MTTRGGRRGPTAQEYLEFVVTATKSGVDESMTFRMDVKVDRVLEEDTYDAILENVEQKETKFGQRLMWTFRIPAEDDTTVVGFTSMSPSTKGHAYTWAAAIMGEIDPKSGWGPEDVIDGRCRVSLGIYEDAQGVEKNKVEKVLRAKPKAVEEDESDFDAIPF